MGMREQDYICIDGVRKIFPIVPVATDFLQPHPATVTWWAQRAKCRRCVHHRIAADGCGERCAAVRARKDLASESSHGRAPAMRALRRGQPTRKTRQRAYCIDARSETHECGPSAKLFHSVRAR